MVEPWLHLCCGDTVGLPKLCNRKAANEAYRECVCLVERLGSKTPPCIQNPDEFLITARKVSIQSKTSHGLDALHLCPIQIAMTDIPLCNSFMVLIISVLEKCFMHMAVELWNIKYKFLSRWLVLRHQTNS